MCIPGFRRPIIATTVATIAILIPCYNEAVTIGKVIDDFRRELPDAVIYVYDNNSADDTAAIAKEHGAIVRSEARQGKGNVVRQMFRDIDADYYVMIDGDDTYPVEAVHDMLKPLVDNTADMAIGDRLSNQSYYKENKRLGHNFGNNLVRSIIKWLYGRKITDAMTGYRALSAIFVRTFPTLSQGFEIEVEMGIHAIDKGWRVVEIPIDYRDRPEGSESKLATVRDGFRVMAAILSLFKDYKPLALFLTVAAVFIIASLLLGIYVLIDFLGTGFVSRFPSALLAVAFVLIGILSLVCGLILDTTAKASRKDYELFVLHEYHTKDQ